MGVGAVIAPESRLSYTAVAGYAERVARENGMVGGDGRVVLGLDGLGGRVVVKARVVESLVVRGVGDFTVYVPVHTSRVRDRFGVAHALGHYFLHYRAPDVYLRGGRCSVFVCGGCGVGEVQANVFASGFLVPGGEFESVLRLCGGDLVVVAEWFGVSVPVVRVRAEFLGFLDLVGG